MSSSHSSNYLINGGDRIMTEYRIIGFVPISKVPGVSLKGLPYSKKEREFIRDNYREMKDAEMAAHLHRTPQGVQGIRQKMGLFNFHRHEWTPEEEQIVYDLYPDTPNTQILEKLPRLTLQSLYKKANTLGVAKSEAFLLRQNRKLGRKAMKNPKMMKNRFQKGHTPANKGLKQSEYMSREAIEKTKDTRFKPGNKPHNTKWDGAITIRHSSKKSGRKPFACIRLAEGKWKEYQIYRWEKDNGPVPKGHVLRCRDGNTLNCSPDNWELITRAEHARRNQNTEKAVAALRKFYKENGHPATELHDSYVAGLLAGGDPELREYLIENRQDLIRLARKNYLLLRKIRESENA